MVYVAGVVGFIGGFAIGLMFLYFLLRNATQEDLLNDRYLKWKYGLINWGFAALGAYSAVTTYKEYFL